MNLITRYWKYAAGLTVGGVVADRGYEKHLYSKATKCMQEHQLAIVTSGCIAGLNPKIELSVVKISAEDTCIVGAVSFIFNSYYTHRPDDWSISIYSRGIEDITPIGKYLAYRETPVWYRFTGLFGHNAQSAPDRIIHSAKKLPVMSPSRMDELNGYYSVNLVGKIKATEHFVKELH
ncbi:MAG: hypothetical protein VX777_10580 [Chlamydiota bacterium]|nr:hypothetical protein [Chlamydiota bacterium]